MPKKHADIGDIAVTEKGCENPYRNQLMGDERSRALGRFFVFGDPGQYGFWYAPACGGALRIEKREDIDVEQHVIDFYWGGPKALRTLEDGREARENGVSGDGGTEGA